MPALVGAELQFDRYISADPANGVLAILDHAAAVQNLIVRDMVQGDVSYFAPAGSVGGGGTRRHLFDRPIESSQAIASGGFRATGALTQTTADGIEVLVSGGKGIVWATNRVGATAWLPLRIVGNPLELEGTPGQLVAKLSSGLLAPGGDNTIAFGSASFRWSDVRAVLATFTTVVAATFSATGLINTTATGEAFSATGGTTSARYGRIANTGSDLRLIAESSIAGTTITGSTAYATIIANASGTSLELATSTTARLSISVAGAFDFKNNPLSGVGGIEISGGSFAAGRIYTAGSGLRIAGVAAGAIEFGLTRADGSAVILSVPVNTNTVEFAGIVRPIVDNTSSLGSASLRWGDVQAMTASFGGVITSTLVGGVGILRWNNNTFLQQKDTGGTYATVFGMANDGILYVQGQNGINMRNIAGTVVWLSADVSGIITATPGGGGVGQWLLGKYAAAATVFDNAHYVEVKIDGVLRKLAVCT